MIKGRPLLWISLMLALAIMIGGSPPFVSAATTNNTLHDVCQGNTAGCTTTSFNGGSMFTTGTTTNPSFGVTRSPDTNSGELLNMTAVVLIPVNDGQLSFSVSGVNTGNAGPVSATLMGTWNPSNGGDDLITNFLGLTRIGGPANTFSGLAGLTSPGGYYVYTAAMGSVTFGSSTDPVLTANGTFAAGTVLMSYVTCAATSSTCTAVGDVFDDTAPSSALMVSGPVPEPSSIALFGSGLAFLGGMLRRKLGKA